MSRTSIGARPRARLGGSSIQRLDPLLTRTHWPIPLAAATGSFTLALFTGITAPVDQGGGIGTILSLVLLASGCLVLVGSTLPRGGLFTVSRHAIVQGLFVAAVTLSMLQHPPELDSDKLNWGPLVLGLLLLTLGQYRPSRELLLATVASAMYLAVLTTAISGGVDSGAERGMFVLSAILPVIALGGAATVFSASTVATLRLWQDQVTEAERAQEATARAAISRSVQQEQVSLLGGAVVPLLAEILETGRIGAAEQRRAAELADRIRSALVADAGQSWLEALLEELGQGAVQDPGRRAARIPAELRARIRALTTAVTVHPAYQRGSLRLGLDPGAPDARIVLSLEAELLDSEARIRAALSPYLAVLRTSFGDFSTTIDSTSLRVRFSCDSDG